MTDITVDGRMIALAKELRDDLQRFLNEYGFGLKEIETKLEILRDDFSHEHEYNPIEHLSSRVKSPDSLIEKVQRKGIDATLESIRENITDIAGVRVTCSFVTDVYRLFELLAGQDDIVVREVKDYIAHPKPNGYQSLHAIVEVPVFLPRGTVMVPVEVQFRTIAMDFWASLEHKIYYKYDRQVPQELLDQLHEAAVSASELDERMENLHHAIRGGGRPAPAPIQIPERGGSAAISA
ncbi:GTP pyrophosphokinase [Microbacterium indicum]|uniref:GTP pyrophosphokinase n=1 Tax=Microbacterium indicum TaxID=358100 RepID=UPI000421AE0F|nr:GTP pyrophosphokinase family protein [Microbacterium indicum]